MASAVEEESLPCEESPHAETAEASNLATEPDPAPAATPAPAPAPDPAPAAAVDTPTQPQAASTQNGATDLVAAAEQRLRELLPAVQDQSVLQELANLADSDALERLVQRGKPPPKVGGLSRGSFKNLNPVSSDGLVKAHASQEAALDKAKNLGTVDNKSLAVGGAGAGGGLGLNKPGFGPKVTHFAGRGSVSSKSIQIHEDCSLAWSQMLDDSSPVSWVICTYSDDGKTLVLKGKGEGGLDEFKSGLPDTVAWCGFKCYGVDKRGGVECKRSKFVFVQYKPEACSQIKKAKQASHKGDVKETFINAHMDHVVETMDDLEEQVLITRLQAATGAHKPNGYEFNVGCFLEADYYGLGIGKSCAGESSSRN